ncbi:RHS repeat-associated core domain-containing protein [Vibrio sp. Hep-1b-8]|uniref:RHS repeat-associated core domain-containing protein n=2 Tax=unclassified Vibrio TaxID=2614977 RepID=UPI001110109A|nr:RHS repeat-associated core domain-containing protein [Vibrio sp. Hep-1b-8]TMX33218.1 type IV secretion protein Rhs [Vibrio sp. Hep-1b-8]
MMRIKSSLCIVALSCFSLPSLSSSVGELSGSAFVSQGKSGYQVDLQLPSGVNELVPSLSVSYQQGSGNGPLGLGVSLDGLSSITRCSRNEQDDDVNSGLRFDDTDVYCLDGKRLFLVSGQLGKNGSEYRTKGGWQTKVVANGSLTSGPDSWTIYSADGYVTRYGSREDAQLTVDGHGLEWFISQQSDRFNNGIDYRYRTHQGQHYLDKIQYADVSLNFNYVNRPDVLSSYRFGQKQTLAQKLDNIQINRSGHALRRIEFTYGEVNSQGIELTRLNSLRVCGSDEECMPAHTFEWESNPYAGSEPEQKTLYRLGEFKGFVAGDINRDGLSDICYLKDGLYCGLNEGNGRYGSAVKWSSDFQGSAWEEAENYASISLMDIDDDSFQDVCAFNETGFFCALNRNGRSFDSGHYWSRNYTIDKAVRLLDANNDGLVDVCRVESNRVVCANNTGSGLSSDYVLINHGYPLEKSYESMKFLFLDFTPEPVKMPQSQFIDINKDGFADLCGVRLDGHFYCSLGKKSEGNLSFEAPDRWANQLPIGGQLPSDPQPNLDPYFQDVAKVEQLQRTMNLVDISGDGLSELCYRSGNNYVCHQNTGKGFETATTRLVLGRDHFEVSNDRENNVAQVEGSIMLSDRNSDGLADFCYIAGERVYCAYGNGDRFNQSTLLATINADLELLDDDITYSDNYVKKIFGIKTTIYYLYSNNIYGPFKKGVDANGDGLLGDCYRSIDGLTCLSYEFEPLALLKSVTSGLGIKSEFEYGMTGDASVFQNAAPPQGLIGLTPNFKVVKALKQDNAIGGTNRTEYLYKGYHAHKDKGLLGFGEIQTHDVERKTKSISTTAYHGDWVPYIAKTETNINNRKVAESHFVYQDVNAPVSGQTWPQLVETNQKAWDLSSNLLTDTTTQYRGYDVLNFPDTITKVIEDGDGGQFIETTTTRYQHDTQRWLIGKPTNINVTKSNRHDSQVRRTSFSYDADTGALVEQTLEPGHALALTTRFGYSPKGFRTSEQTTGSGETRQSATAYDVYGRVTRHTNALGHTVSTTYDNQCGLPQSITDANGLVTRFEYDDYCREVKKTLPDGNWVAQVYEWSDGADAGLDQHGLTLGDRSVFMVTTQTSQGGLSTTYFDGLGREVRTTQLNGDGKTVIVDIAYDAKGQKVGETMPYFEGDFAGDATFWLQTAYDDLGRPIRQTQPTEDVGDLVSTTYYQGLTATITGPGQFEKVEQTNGLGQTVQITENGQSTVRYTYDAVGNLTKTDTNGLVTELTYNQLGYKTQMNDPAMGVWTYGHNAWGELVWQQDAKGQHTTFTYDALGRKTGETRPDGVNQWQYDQVLKGGLDVASSDNSNRSYTYDALGRTESMTLTIDGSSYTTQYEYNEQGRLSRVIFPSGMNLDKDYDVNGLLKRMSIPYSDIWDSQYLQIETALMETSERIMELEAQAYELEQSAQFYIEESERLRQAAEQLFAQSASYQNTANQLSASAQSLFRSASINIQRANRYRAKANYYWSAYSGTIFNHYKTQNGYAYYKYDRCLKKDWKGNCKTRKVYTERVPLWMVQNNFCWPSSGKLKAGCFVGPSSSVNLTQVYKRWADHYYAIANRQRAQANQKQSQANHYQALSDNAEARADELITQAQSYASLARTQTDLLSDLTDELDDLVVAEAELQEIMDQRLEDETAEIVWVATSRDNFGRIGGELFGNGLLTRRDIDRSRGTVQRITTGMGDTYLRDINYTYDERSNVLSKVSAIRNQSEYYQYDDFDRLTQWNFSDNKSVSSIERDYRYDVYGNLTYKTDQGDFEVNPNGQLTNGYTYDANGNMLAGRGRTLAWNSFNKARHINDNGNIVQYQYGSERERVKQTANGVTTYYISPEYQLELSTDNSGKTVTIMRHRFLADNQAVAEHVKTLIGSEKQIDRTAYFHRDALGTADLITDPNGQVQIERGYTPFGELLASAELQATPMFTNAEMRGFTGHENVGNSSGLINMNARLYDPVIGRFLSADTFVPEPSFSQSYNRYAYVYNNPLKYTDPTGHWVWWAAAMAFFVVSQTFENPAIQMAGMVVGAIAIGYAASGLYAGLQPIAQAAASGATASFSTTYITTGDFDDSLQAGIIGGLSAGITYGVAHGATGGTSPFGAALPLAHGVVQGGFHELQGGSFKQGFISGVIGKLGGGIVHNNVQTQTLQAGGMIIVSGIAAAASGANSRDAVMRSAVSVITVYLYNDLRGMNGIAKMSEANTIIKEVNDAATKDSVEFFKKEGPALAVDSLTVTVGSIDCIAGTKIGCAPALWAAASIDARWNQQPHIVEQGLTQMNVPYASELTNLIGLGLSVQGTINFMQGYTTLDNTIDAVGTGVILYESSHKP